MPNKNVIYVTGLPRAGSTLLCQVLGEHPLVYSPGHSSPLCQTLNGLRHHLSDSDFMLSQLDVDFELGHTRLVNAFRGFMDGWFAETDSSWVVDKNRAWLQQLETVELLDPDFRMLVCLRDLGQVFGSIEAQHRKSLLLDFPDHLAALSPAARAEKLFAPEGVVGGPLGSLQALQDLPHRLHQRLFFVMFEDLMQRPVELTGEIYEWLGLPGHAIDADNLTVRPHESDSYYRFKYRHRTSPRIRPPASHNIPQRIAVELQRNFDWYYDMFYPSKNPAN